MALLCKDAVAYSTFQAKIPNGDMVMYDGSAWPGVGHILRQGTGARNPFGIAFNTAGNMWTTALCQEDSDGDGETNGAELGDPECVWTEGATPARTTDITHPGFAPPTTTTTTTVTTTTTNSTDSMGGSDTMVAGAQGVLPFFGPCLLAVVSAMAF
eukprot:CAMPEP_0178427820 /NCGR_PEP_ID=MMETSP0689_2-20121128/29943_1 /TAXON_ID=160604 /ORGANISM="Amphidinium massartii, Strain CS-259" /LENGTH=155 /DNA_ID=CAMNT_0020049541 /DNA_START=121 /DNA_END=588 /DNA_ORIENTATION=-